MNIIDRPTHADWLREHCFGLLQFGLSSAAPNGGAVWLDEHGDAIPEEGVQTWITARMVHVYSLGVLLGFPGAASVAEAALAGLTGPLRDSVGWHGRIGGDQPTPPTKSAYEHAFVVLAASSAKVAGLPGATELLDDALTLFSEKFWDEEHSKVVDTFNSDFSELDDYRGINANMHTVEALLAAADVTGEPLWRDRAAKVAAFAVAQAESNGWRLPEHYDANWQPLLEFNVEQPGDQFKPYGATVGHGLEWARLFLHIEAAGGLGADWRGAAQALYAQAVEDGWDEEFGGFFYTTDWTGQPVVRDRMHWVVAEAIGAAAALWQATGAQRYSDDYTRWWDFAATHLIDAEQGSWRHQLDGSNQPADSVWRGKPDLYHAVQATLLPQLPLAPTLATALAQTQER